MLDDVRANIRRTALGLLVCFALIALALGYWQVWRAADLANDAANPRVAQERQFAPRGRILDRNDQVLASSEQTPDGMRRRYSQASLVHTIGFFSPRFGETNLELAYDAELRGDRPPSLADRLRELVLPRSEPATSDLVLTIDSRVHQAAMEKRDHGPIPNRPPANCKPTIPSSRRETLKVTSAGSLDCARG